MCNDFMVGFLQASMWASSQYYLNLIYIAYTKFCFSTVNCLYKSAG